MTWTPELQETVVEHWNAGKSAGEIAALIGRVKTRNAVIGWVNRNQDKVVRKIKSHKTSMIETRRRARKPSKPRQVAGTPKPSIRKLKIIASQLETKDISLMELKPYFPKQENTCRMPVGEATGEDQLFCGNTCKGVYCDVHSAIVYTGRRGPLLKPELLPEVKVVEVAA